MRELYNLKKILEGLTDELIEAKEIEKDTELEWRQNPSKKNYLVYRNAREHFRNISYQMDSIELRIQELENNK